MVRRVVIGNRGGVNGIFVSKPGFDALTTGESNLNLSISQKVSNVLRQGVVGSSATIALGYSSKPQVLVTSLANLSPLPDIAWPSYLNGPARPSPAHHMLYDAYAIIQSGGAYLSVIGPVPMYYTVYSRVI